MSDSFLILFLNSAFNERGYVAALSLFFLFMARMLPIIALAPFLGARTLPQAAKIAMGIALFVVFLPSLLLSVSSPLEFDLYLVTLLLKELFVGFLLGFLISMPFSIVQSAGIMIDHQRGGSSLMVNDPTIQNQSSPLGTMFNMVLIWLFYYIDGPFIFFEAILTSYEVIPADKFFAGGFFSKSSSFWQGQIALLNQVMIISIRLATPALIVILMTDFFLGIANRLAPQVQITFLGMPLKSLLALLIIFVGWRAMMTEFGRQANYWLNQVVNTLRMLKEGGAVGAPEISLEWGGVVHQNLLDSIFQLRILF